MKKYLLPLILLAAPAFAAQQEITVVPDSPVLPSIGALKDAVNLRLTDIDENFDEIYPILTAGPVYVNPTTPADTKVVWIDTDQDNTIKVYIGGVWTVVGTASSGDNLGNAAYSDVVALWTTCTGYLKSDGTCDTPSGSATYPSAAGVANWNGSAWGTSYAVGTSSNNLVQLNASAQLPAVSADLLTVTDTGSYFTTDTVGAALQELGSDLAAVTEITIGTGLTDTNGTLSVTYPVTAEAWSGSGWNADTDGLARNDAYDYLHIADTDDDGLPNKVDLSSAGIVKADANGVVAVATAGTDYLTTTNLATGSTDNAILRANGTGGSTAQASGVTIDDNDNVTVPGVIKGRTLFNSYAADQTLTAATHNSTVVQMTVAGEVTMWDCETANVGDQVILWARDAEKIEVVPASGDHFALFNGTALTADYEMDVPATAGTKVTLLCTADDTWSVFHETATTTDGGAAD